MLDLVRFELKKLLVRRTSLIACAGILVMLCGIMALNVAQTRTTSNADEVLTGTAAIAHQKEKPSRTRACWTPIACGKRWPPTWRSRSRRWIPPTWPA